MISQRLSRRRLLRVFLLLLVLDICVLIGGSVAGGLSLYSIQRSVTVTHVDVHRLSPLLQSVQGRLRIAEIGLGAARVASFPWRAVAGLISLVPPLRMAAAFGPILDLAYHGSAAGINLLDGALPTLTVLDKKNGSGETSVRLLGGLEQGGNALQSALDNVTFLESDLASLPPTILPHAIRGRLSQARHLLPRLKEGLRAAVAAPDLLGAHAPRLYLVVPENSWDLRATGGFIGTAALLRVDQGHLTLTSQSSDAVDMGRTLYIQPPLPLLTYQHFSNWFYRDANWFPNFPTSAGLLRYLYWLGQRHVLGPHAPDGVIAFDSSLLSPLLTLTGPVTVSVSGKPTTIDAAHGIAILDHVVNASGTVNKGVAAAAYTAVFHRLLKLPFSSLQHAVGVIGNSIAEKHLLLWVHNQDLAAILAQHAWDGAISSAFGDYLYVVDTNVHYNKINHFVQEAVTYHARIDPDRSIYSMLTITYTNTATLKKLPPPQNNTYYEDFLRVLTPLGSHLLHASGITAHWATTEVANKTVFAGYIRVPALSHKSITFIYKIPANALLDAHHYHITVQKQPGTETPLPLSIQILSGGNSVHVGVGSQWGWSGRLVTDLHLIAPLSGGVPAPEPLAKSIGAPIVIPGQQLDPWTALPPNLPQPANN